MILNVQELGFLYRNHDVLHDIAFEVNHGEIMAILGPNGVGKTTLLKCLNRILNAKRAIFIWMDQRSKHLKRLKLPVGPDMFPSGLRPEDSLRLMPFFSAEGLISVGM
jgi:ABC-type cobalamin/Fe3+-siderophores transport system ATPase subunit